VTGSEGRGEGGRICDTQVGREEQDKPDSRKGRAQRREGKGHGVNGCSSDDKRQPMKESYA
jgi:hypothetical protein